MCPLCIASYFDHVLFCSQVIHNMGKYTFLLDPTCLMQIVLLASISVEKCRRAIRSVCLILHICEPIPLHYMLMKTREELLTWQRNFADLMSSPSSCGLYHAWSEEESLIASAVLWGGHLIYRQGVDAPWFAGIVCAQLSLTKDWKVSVLIPLQYLLRELENLFLRSVAAKLSTKNCFSCWLVYWEIPVVEDSEAYIQSDEEALCSA